MVARQCRHAYARAGRENTADWRCGHRSWRARGRVPARLQPCTEKPDKDSGDSRQSRPVAADTFEDGLLLTSERGYMMKLSRLVAASSVGLVLLLAGCGGDSASAAPGEALPTGEVIEVGMISDPSRGEVFDPPTVTAKPGDVIRWKLVSGVHNASFPANRNPSGVTLPRATPYLQAPGQTHDMVVDLPPGEYTFQCDPHVALGMFGTLIVE
jgi:plastocyanin